MCKIGGTGPSKRLDWIVMSSHKGIVHKHFRTTGEQLEFHYYLLAIHYNSGINIWVGQMWKFWTTCFCRSTAEQTQYPRSTKATETATFLLDQKIGLTGKVLVEVACSPASPVEWKHQPFPRSTSPSGPWQNRCGLHLRNRRLHLSL